MSVVFNTPLRDLPSGCGSCPDVILGLISGDVSDMLVRVRKVKRIVTCMNRYSHFAAEIAIAELEKILAMIPEPPFLDVRFITGMFTCPLTPQALTIEALDKVFSAVQKAATGVPYPARLSTIATTASREISNEAIWLSTLDRPRDALIRIMRIIEGFARQLKELVDELLTGVFYLDTSGFLRLSYRLAGELLNTLRDADLYAIKLTVTVGSVALVRNTCPSVYERQDMPFKAFDYEMSGFSFDGLLPSGFEGEAARVASLFAQLQGKLARWQSVSLLAVA